MSAVQEAAANTVLRIANLFEQNCALKHGLPKVGGPDRIDAEPPAPQPINITNNIPAAPAAINPPSPGGGVAQQAESTSLLRRAAPYLLTGLLAGGVPTAAIAYLNKQPAAVTIPTEQDKDGSLLQLLQDRGLHLPEGTWPTK